MDLSQLIGELAFNYPVISTVIGFVGAMRLIFKPIGTLIRKIANSTATPKDNEAIARVEASKAYKAFVYAIDYLLSVKIRK